jgi:hypothetical protein
VPDAIAESRVAVSTDPRSSCSAAGSADLTWRALAAPTRIYLTAVIAAGMSTFAAFFPRTFPEPLLFSVLVVLACVTSVWKVNLPIPLASGPRVGVRRTHGAAPLGPSHAMAIAVVGAWMQCTYRQLPYPLYRTIFGTAAQALTMIATGVVYLALGGQIRPSRRSTSPGLWLAPSPHIFSSTPDWSPGRSRCRLVGR